MQQVHKVVLFLQMGSLTTRAIGDYGIPRMKKVHFIQQFFYDCLQL
jgi:hypothetical protein